MLSVFLKTAMRNYYENQILDSGSNTKRKWQLIREFFNTPLQRDSVASIKTNESLVTAPRDIANCFKQHFSAESSGPSSLVYTPTFTRQPQSLFIIPSNPAEIEAVILGLKATRPGLDRIQGKHIKLICPFILPMLGSVFHLVFKTSVFPSVFKLAKVVPVFKKGDPNQIENYRPISVLPFFDKVREKLIEKRLSN